MWFYMIRTILINCGSTCHRFCRRSWFISLNIVDNWSPRLWKNGFQHFCQKSNLYHGFGRNRLGQDDRNDRGIISGFRRKCNFDMCFTGQSPHFPENLDFHVLCLNCLFFAGGHMCEAFIFQNIEYTPFFSKQIYPICFHGFHGFPEISIFS